MNRLLITSTEGVITILLSTQGCVSASDTTGWLLSTSPYVGEIINVPAQLSPQSQMASWQDLLHLLYGLNQEGT